jgi:hypothetical protein
LGAVEVCAKTEATERERARDEAEMRVRRRMGEASKVRMIGVDRIACGLAIAPRE